MTFSPVLPVIVAAFLLAALISLVVTPVLRRFLRGRGILDQPNDRRVNRRPLPRGGGIAVVIAFVAVASPLIVFASSIPGMPDQRGVSSLQLLGLIGGGICAAVIGFVDDLLDLRARWQLLGQVGLAILAIASGITIGVLSNPFASGPIAFAYPFAVVFTIIWIVGMINSINFIDGLDGLSTGIALIAASTLGILSLGPEIQQPFLAILCFAFAGALLGFLRWNFFPAIVFQGTAGVMFVGYTLAVLSILGTTKVVVALLVLGVPIIDSFWVIVRRLSGGRSPFTPDRGHIHHRLLDLGLSHRATVLLIYGICGTLGVVSLVVSSATGVYAFLGALVMFGVLIFALARGEQQSLEPRSYEDQAGS